MTITAPAEGLHLTPCIPRATEPCCFQSSANPSVWLPQRVAKPPPFGSNRYLFPCPY